MIGFHLQGNVDNWPAAAAELPPGAPMKFCEGVQRCAEVKAANPGIYTVVRHVVYDQHPQGDLQQQARDFYATFVDDSFRKEARHVNAICEWNEYFADSQTAVERDKWIAWTTAAVEVWRDDYRSQAAYQHIELIVAETAVGNDIPVAIARLSHRCHWVILGYHPYVPVWQKQIRPDEWRWYSGRWESMDLRFLHFGLKVRWFFGEFGAVGHNGPGWPHSLAPNDGWQHEDVYDGDLAEYIGMMIYWMRRAQQSQAWKEGRIIGATIFTSGGGSLWRHFELKQPELGMVARAVSDYIGNCPPPPTPEPPPPPTGDPKQLGAPRIQYDRTYLCVPQMTGMEDWLAVCAAAHRQKQTVGFSYDDAGVGDLEQKTAVLYGLTAAERLIFARWFAAHYPEVKLEYRPF